MDHAFDYSKLFELIENRKIKVRELLDKNIISRNTYYSMKNGGNISTDSIIRLSEYLGINPLNYIKYKPVPNNDND